MRLETDEYRSRPPSYSRGAQPSHGYASSSSPRLKEFQYNSRYHSHAKPHNQESEKMELLRMVYELQEQLNKTTIWKGDGIGGYTARVAEREKHFSSYPDHLAAGREMYHDLNHHRYPGSYGQGKSWSQPCNPARMAFSGEPSHSRNQLDCSCLHCFPQDRHCSAQLPPHVVGCSKGRYGNHPSHLVRNPYHSGPSSPQHPSRPDFSLQSHETDVQLHRITGHEVKHHHSPKRQVLPVAGEAPWIACYRCSKLLQLPAEFLLFRRRKYHTLRCSACSEVLKFSLQNNTHVVRYVSEPIAPPSSEVDDLQLASRASYGPHVEPGSCSDDYGPSFRKSYSTETDRFSLAPPSNTLERNPKNRKMSSSSSGGQMDDRNKSILKDLRTRFKNAMQPKDSVPPLEDRKNSILEHPSNPFKNSVQPMDSDRPMEDRKKSILEDPTNRFKNSAEPTEQAGPSSKISSEIEEIRPSAGSPLHRIMGYSSPSKVIRG